jgi:hypothetical protein
VWSYKKHGEVKEHMKTNEKIHRTRQDHQPIAVIANRHPQIKKPGTKVGLPDASGSLLESALDAELSLPELIGAGVLNFKLLECTSKLGLDLSLGSTLELHADLRRGDGALDLVDISLEVGLGIVTSREVLVSLLELLSILDHLVDLGGRETTNRVGDA